MVWITNVNCCLNIVIVEKPKTTDRLYQKVCSRLILCRATECLWIAGFVQNGKILWKLSEENLIGYENSSHRLSEEYRNESAERLKGMNMNYLKLVSGCFHKNGYINRSFLKKVFQDMLSEKQIRGLISKMKNAGIIQKDGAGKYTRYVKAPDFPSFV